VDNLSSKSVEPDSAQSPASGPRVHPNAGMRLVAAALSVVVLVLSASGFQGGAAVNESVPPAGQQLKTIRDAVRVAHASGDAAAYLAKSREMRDFLHGSPNSILQAMSAEAFAGDQEAALRSFERFIAMGQSNQAVFQGKQFEELRKSEKFRILEVKMRKNDAPIARAAEVFRMAETGLIPEDIDYDPRTAHFYVTSVMKGEILVFDKAGHSRVFAHAPHSWPMMALKIDSSRRVLWATEVALHPFKSVPEADWGTSTILIYDLDSGRLVDRVAGPPKTTLGDMALTKDGDAIVSDNEEGGVYRVNRKTHNIERLDEGDFISPQTAVMSPDNRHVFVPDYTRGIGILDLTTKHVSWLASRSPRALSGIDGLYLYGRTLVATQNGTSPERVVRFELDKSLMHVESESIVERATATLGDPTHGVLVDGSFYYIANSGWDAIEDDGSPKAEAVPSKALVMKYEGIGNRK
jgi:hypothetical protein